MLLDLSRQDPQMTTVILGVLQVDGLFECFTLERLGVEIPVGSYPIELTYSPHFQRDMPLIDNVPNRTAIRIHPGNIPMDSDGCILVGTSHNTTGVQHSRLAFESLLKKITAALASGETVKITVH